MNDFIPFPKIFRFSREVIVTEKLDGTNAQIHFTDVGNMFVGSRTKWITSEDDNYGFAKWAHDNRTELEKLGPGSHFGEWWGAGIQRKYDLKEKRFSLFNVSRWSDDAVRPACCHVVPELWRGSFDEMDPEQILNELKTSGSKAAPGFLKPEGIVIFHVSSNFLFKKTIEKDEEPKSVTERKLKQQASL